MQRIRSTFALLLAAAAFAGGAGVASAQEPEPDFSEPAEASETESVGPPEMLLEAPAPMDAAPGTLAMEGMDAYTIQPGDTLWDVCARFLGDPFYWPKLWSLNQYITNPHWIYPGNLLVFREGTETAPPQFEVTKPEAVAVTEPVPDFQPVEPVAVQPVAPENLQEGFQIPVQETPVETVAVADEYALTPITQPQNPFEINLRQEGLISETQIPPLGHVYKSEEEVDLLAEGHEVYLKLTDGSAQVGKKYTVYRTLRRVKHPKTRGYMGFLIKILAELEVTAVNGDIATARVRTSYDYINRGDPITDYVSVLKRVNLQPNTAQLDGVIVETMVEGLSILGNGDVIYIDKGTADGLQIGNTVDVVRTGDGIVRMSGESRDRSLPQEVVGRLVIVGAQERTSTAVIVDAYDALSIGDSVRVAPN